MGLKKWFKRKMASLALTMSSVEKQALGQDGGSEIGNESAQHQRLNQGSLADDLVQGEVTQQVQELRWRMYKVLEESKKIKSKVVGYDEDGFMLTEQVDVDENSNKLTKVKLDGFDYYPLELMVLNDEVTMSVLDGINGVNGGDDYKSTSKVGEVSTLGDVKGELNDASNKAVKVINCVREYKTKFDIEKFTKKMNVRKISDTEKLLEFYVSIYPDEYDRRSRFFISEIKKGIKNPRACDFLDLLKVNFVSYNTLGVKDLMEFEYEIVKFDKIITYDGNYVIKFIANVTKNGDSLYEKFRDESLDERYKNKERKDN